MLRIDPRRREVTKTIELEQGVQDMAVGAGAVWVTGRRDDVVTRVDIRTAEQREFHVGEDPSASRWARTASGWPTAATTR